MKIAKDTTNKQGHRVLTIVCDRTETIFALRPNSHYKLGGQVEDVMDSHILADATEVYWNSIEQEWSDA